MPIDMDKIARWASRKLNVRFQDQEDARQEIELRLLKYPPDPDRTEAEQSAYARRIALTAISRYVRREARQPIPSDGAGIREVDETTAEDWIVASQTQSAIREGFREALAQMTRAERIYLLDAYGLARAIQVRPSAAAGTRARKRLLEILRGRGVEGLRPSDLCSYDGIGEVWGEYLADAIRQG
jgi:hypothetical protein